MQRSAVDVYHLGSYTILMTCLTVSTLSESLLQRICADWGLATNANCLIDTLGATQPLGFAELALNVC